mgnify:CR=1 FL=1
MKTIQELYNEIITNDELKKAFAAASQSEEGIVAFAKEHGVDTNLDEIKAFLKELTQTNNKELAPEEMENAAGGTCNKRTDNEEKFSIFTLGVGCAFEALISAVAKDRHVGQEKDADGRLCNPND